MVGTPRVQFSGPDDRRARTTTRSTLTGTTWTARYDLSWHKDKHDIKIGGEYLHVHDTGDWYIQAAGRYTMSSACRPNLAAAAARRCRARSVARGTWRR